MCSARQACNLSKAERLKHTLGIYGVQEAVIALVRCGTLPLQTGFSTVLKKKKVVMFTFLLCFASHHLRREERTGKRELPELQRARYKQSRWTDLSTTGRPRGTRGAVPLLLQLHSGHQHTNSTNDCPCSSPPATVLVASATNCKR